MTACQSTILDPPPVAARLLTLGLALGGDPREVAEHLADVPIEDCVIGLGEPFLAALERKLEGLRSFPAFAGPRGTLPSTQGALWIFVRGGDPGEAIHRARAVLSRLGPGVRLDEDVACHLYAGGRDLSGYEDGTENPKGDAAVEAALTAGRGEGLDGGSFVAVQRWVHDLGVFEKLGRTERDFVMGRSLETNEELADAPESAHVKRAAQESYDPPAFMLRRSMPWGDVERHGLYFVAYGATLDPFERVLRRMTGLEDGVPDALFTFTRPITGGYYWCPPSREGRLDLRAIR